MQKKYLLSTLAVAFVTLGIGCEKTVPPTSITSQNTEPIIAAEDLFGTAPPQEKTIEPPSSLIVNEPTNPPTTTMEFNASKHYTAILHTTKGDIEIALNFGETPNTVKNFIDLAQKSFYTNTIFHRAIKGFMIQGGDPNGNGTGGPGYRFDDEPFSGEYTRGAVAMANAGPNTNGSQFFIMHADYPLPKSYTIFGHVTTGMDVVDAIATDKVQMSASGELSSPVSPTTVTGVEIQEK